MYTGDVLSCVANNRRGFTVAKIEITTAVATATLYATACPHLPGGNSDAIRANGLFIEMRLRLLFSLDGTGLFRSLNHGWIPAHNRARLDPYQVGRKSGTRQCTDAIADFDNAHAGTGAKRAVRADFDQAKAEAATPLIGMNCHP